MLARFVATGVIAKAPYISLKVNDLRDETQSLVQARVQITEISSESDTEYNNADDGKIKLSFNVVSIDGNVPSDQGIKYTIGSSDSSIEAIAGRETAVTFTGFNAGTYELSARDESLNATFEMTLNIGYGSEPSFVRYKNANYSGVGSIHFMPVLCSNPSGAGTNVTITNVRDKFATIQCNGVTRQPDNKPGTGTYLGSQQFAISGLDGSPSSSYAMDVYDPITRVTHNLFLSAGYRDYISPSLKINYLDSETTTTNDGAISITFNSNEALSADGVIFSLDNGTIIDTKTSTIGNAVVFAGLDSSLVGNNDLIITDTAKNRTWTLKLRIGYDGDISYIQYNNDNVLYQTGDTIIFKTEQGQFPAKTKILYQNKSYYKGDTIELS